MKKGMKQGGQKNSKCFNIFKSETRIWQYYRSVTDKKMWWKLFMQDDLSKKWGKLKENPTIKKASQWCCASCKSDILKGAKEWGESGEHFADLDRK